MSIVDELVCFVSRCHGLWAVVVVSLVDDNSDSFLLGFVVCRVNVSIDCGLADLWVGWVMVFDGEFDPGSGRTLAACLTHASRAERPTCGYSSGERVSNT